MNSGRGAIRGAVRGRSWRRALAGTCLAVAAGWASSPAAVAGPVFAIPVPPGQLAISPGEVTAGSSDLFTLTFTANTGFDGGTLIVQVPAGWPAPNLTSGSSGFTATACTACGLAAGPDGIELTNLVLAPPVSTGTATPSSATSTPSAGTATPSAAALFRPPSSVAITYSATVPLTAGSGTFSATAKQGGGTVLADSGSAAVTVDAASTTPASTPASTSASTPASTPAGVAGSPSSGQGPGSGVPITLVLILVAGFAVLLAATWFLRGHRGPTGTQPVQPVPPLVRAVPHAGPPVQLSIHPNGPEATHTVRIEPHSGAATTTIKERRP